MPSEFELMALQSAMSSSFVRIEWLNLARGLFGPQYSNERLSHPVLDVNKINLLPYITREGD